MRFRLDLLENIRQRKSIMDNKPTANESIPKNNNYGPDILFKCIAKSIVTWSENLKNKLLSFQLKTQSKQFNDEIQSCFEGEVAKQFIVLEEHTENPSLERTQRPSNEIQNLRLVSVGTVSKLVNFYETKYENSKVEEFLDYSNEIRYEVQNSIAQGSTNKLRKFYEVKSLSSAITLPKTIEHQFENFVLKGTVAKLLDLFEKMKRNSSAEISNKFQSSQMEGIVSNLINYYEKQILNSEAEKLLDYSTELRIEIKNLIAQGNVAKLIKYHEEASPNSTLELSSKARNKFHYFIPKGTVAKLLAFYEKTGQKSSEENFVKYTVPQIIFSKFMNLLIICDDNCIEEDEFYFEFPEQDEQNYWEDY